MRNFECKKCGKCCSNYLPLTEKEINTMKKLAKKENKHPLMQDWYDRFPFLNTNNKCDIYENRPSICKSFTCENYTANVYEGEILDKINKQEKFKVVNIRKEIFNKE